MTNPIHSEDCTVDNKLIDWRIGHHIEAAGKMIAAALNRIADQMEQDHRLKAAEVDLRREHLLTVLEQRATADRAAQRLLGMIPEMPIHDLRDPASPLPKGPEWIKDVLDDVDAHTDRQ